VVLQVTAQKQLLAIFCKELRAGGGAIMVRNGDLSEPAGKVSTI
jgi:hypothetical protein